MATFGVVANIVFHVAFGGFATFYVVEGSLVSYEGLLIKKEMVSDID